MTDEQEAVLDLGYIAADGSVAQEAAAADASVTRADCFAASVRVAQLGIVAAGALRGAVEAVAFIAFVTGAVVGSTGNR